MIIGLKENTKIFKVAILQQYIIILKLMEVYLTEIHINVMDKL